MNQKRELKPLERMLAAVVVLAVGLVAMSLNWYAASVAVFGINVDLTTNGFGSSIGSGAANVGTEVNTISWLPFGWVSFLGLIVLALAMVALYRETWLRLPEWAHFSPTRGFVFAGALEAVGALAYLISSSQAISLNPEQQAEFSAVGGSLGVGPGVILMIIVGVVTCALALRAIPMPNTPDPGAMTPPIP